MGNFQHCYHHLKTFNEFRASPHAGVEIVKGYKQGVLSDRSASA